MMIYLIDDKPSRQADYGWNEDKLSSYKDILIVIRNLDDLKNSMTEIFNRGNIILYHESFLNSLDKETKDFMIIFENRLLSEEDNLYVARFSGSKNSTWINNNKCMLPPAPLYENLETFIFKHREGMTNFKYLAYGEEYEIEESLSARISAVNEENARLQKVETSLNLFFAVTSEEPLDVPFSNAKIDENWDFFDESVADKDLDELITKWFLSEEFDAIFVPLCFGRSLSDFLGLRLAMHARLTDTPNRLTPIYIYGEASFREIAQNECFDVLKMSGVYYTSSNYNDLKEIINDNYRISESIYKKDLRRIHLNIPSNIGDNHSIANRWSIYRWIDMLDWDGDVPQILNSEFLKSLYFKYLAAKHGGHDKFSKKHKYDKKIDGIEGKTILYIDDEYDKGWENILRGIFESSKANFICFKNFDKKASRQELIERIEDYLNNNDADCFLIDLRLHEDDFENTQRENLTGHSVAKYIKHLNSGNQIVVFTASNKIWNLKEELFKIGASGYALKESPDQNLKRKESLSLYHDFANAIKQACGLSYLKSIVKEQSALKNMAPSSEQLDSIINLLSKDQGNNDQDLLGAVLLVEMVFVEDFIKNQLGFELLSTGEKDLLSVELCTKSQKQYPITGHLFFRRIQNGSYTIVIDVSEYCANSIKAPSGWCEATKSDVTLVCAALMIVFELPRKLVKDYIDLKYIRNTQIAHAGNGNKKISSNQVVDFYNNVICKMVKKSSQQP